MRNEVSQLVEAVRALSLQRFETPEGTGSVRIGCPRAEFSQRMLAIAEALEALDKVGAAALEAAEPPPAMDPVKLRLALDGVFRWMKSMGMEISEPHAVVAAALTGAGGPEKKQAAYKPVPRFAHNGFKKTSKPKPLLNLVPTAGEKVSLASLREREAKAEMVDNMLGPAAARA